MTYLDWGRSRRLRHRQANTRATIRSCTRTRVLVLRRRSIPQRCNGHNARSRQVMSRQAAIARARALAPDRAIMGGSIPTRPASPQSTSSAPATPGRPPSSRCTEQSARCTTAAPFDVRRTLVAGRPRQLRHVLQDLSRAQQRTRSELPRIRAAQLQRSTDGHRAVRRGGERPGIDDDGPIPSYRDTVTPTVSHFSSTDMSLFPSLDTGAIAGWMYFNLDNPLDSGFPRQAWIVTTLALRDDFPAIATRRRWEMVVRPRLTPRRCITGETIGFSPAPLKT